MRHKLALASLAALIPIILLGVYDYRSDYHRQEDAVLQGGLGTAQSLAALVDNTFDQARGVGLALSVDSVILSLDPGRVGPYVARYRSIYPQYESINVWDASGQGVAGSGLDQSSAQATSIADREHFQRATLTGRPVLSDVILARTTGRPSASVVVPLKDSSERVLGAISILFDLGVLPGSFREIPLRPGEVVVVADTTGRLAIDSVRPALSWQERDVSWYTPVRRTLVEGSFAGLDRGITDSDSRVVAMARTKEYGWVVGVLVPASVALGPAQEQAMEHGALDFAIVLIAVIAAFALTRAIAPPLEELSRAIGAFGRGDLTQRAHVRTGDELEAVASTFNHMASSLQKEYEQLRFLLEAGTALTSSLEAERILAVLTERSVDLLGDFAWACLTHARTGECALARHHGKEGSTTNRLGLLFGDAKGELMQDLLRLSARDEKSILVEDVAASDLAEGVRYRLLGEGVASLLIVPLRGRDRILGLFAHAGIGPTGRLNGEQLAVAEDLAQRAAVSIDNALLFEEAKDERRQLDAVIERMAEGITVARGDGQIVHLNRRAREILGLPPIGEQPLSLEEHLAQVDLQYPDGRTVPLDQRPIARAIRGEVFNGAEGVVIRRDGTTAHLLFSSGVVQDGGAVRLAMTIYTDITPIKELERAREEFISVVAHDLRSPITTITGYASILRQLPPDLHGGPREVKALDNILSSSHRLDRMVADLLDASRIESRHLILAVEQMDLPSFLPEVVERARELISGHRVRLEIAPGMPPVSADPGRLEQIMGNLLSNAGKYSSAGSEIVVSAEARGGEVVVSVLNYGEGLAPEDREEVFSRFHRTRSAHTSGTPGLGLGLYITKGLVEAHGGRIWVESDVGISVTFRFALPATREGGPGSD